METLTKNGGMALETIFNNALVTVGENIFSLGGLFLHRSGVIYGFGDVLVFNFTLNETLQHHTYKRTSNEDPLCDCCQGYLLPDNKTIVLMGIQMGEGYAVGFDFFDTVDMKWLYTSQSLNASLFPPLRRYASSAISIENDALYLIGGSETGYNTPVGIIRYDLINQTSVVDLSIANPSLNFSLLGACANMLPNGVVVLAFGSDGSFNLYNSSEVLLFDTNSNEIRVHPINGIAPNPRMSASSTLGPDKTTIYYFGGHDKKNALNFFDGEVYNDLMILDTSTWSWITHKISGLAPASSSLSSMTVFDQNKIFISTGQAFNFYKTTVSVLKNVPGIGESIESSNLQWFTNYDVFDNPSSSEGLSSGAIAGITIGAMLFVSIVIFLLWRYVPATKRVVKYIPQDLIWNPRAGEPLWAETTRLLVRFILLVLFLSFVVYVIYRSIESPIIPQLITEKTSQVLFPGIFDFVLMVLMTLSLHLFLVHLEMELVAQTRLYHQNNTKHAPVYMDFFGNVSCTMFYPGPEFYIINGNQDYSNSIDAKLQFAFFAEPQEYDNIDLGVIHIDFYPPGYNPNLKAQELTNEIKPADEEYSRWLSEERSSNSIKTILLQQGVISTATYTLTTIKEIRKNDGWNFIGFSSTYDDSMDVETSYKDSPQSLGNIPPLGQYNRSTISQLYVQPDAFVLTTNKEQKVFTLLNAFAQVGGVLGLFIVVQTILFGFRPQSPWGIIHRWSFGSLRVELTDKLASSFNEKGKSVPLFDPISKRLNSIDRQRIGSSSKSVYLTDASIDSQEDWKHRIEDRLHLMEHVFKNYYLDDEIFRSLKITADRNREESWCDNTSDVQVKNNGFVAQKNTVENDDDDINTPTNDIVRSSSLVSCIRTQELGSDSSNYNSQLISYDREYK